MSSRKKSKGDARLDPLPEGALEALEHVVVERLSPETGDEIADQSFSFNPDALVECVVDSGGDEVALRFRALGAVHSGCAWKWRDFWWV